MERNENRESTIDVENQWLSGKMKEMPSLKHTNRLHNCGEEPTC